MLLLEGAKVSQKIRRDLNIKSEQLKVLLGRPPALEVILVGENPASHIYVRNKEKACQEVGIKSVRTQLATGVGYEEVASAILRANENPQTDGILLQLPLPPPLEAHPLIDLISPFKDVDGLTSENMGLLFGGRPRVISCTPRGVITLLKHYQIPTVGQNAVVIGKSNIVGKPMAALLWDSQATVTVCHSSTRDLRAHTLLADILVVAVGKAKFIDASYLNSNCTVVDVGINRLDSGKICGDVDFESAKTRVKAITPVPGGIGPMTITMLLENTLKLAELRGT